MKEESKQSELPPQDYVINITDWDALCLNDLTVEKNKVSMLHPYAYKTSSHDISKKIEVEVQGEYKNGVPNGLCYMWYVYKGELGFEASPNQKGSDPYLDGQVLTFKGIGTF